MLPSNVLPFLMGFPYIGPQPLILNGQDPYMNLMRLNEKIVFSWRNWGDLQHRDID